MELGERMRTRRIDLGLGQGSLARKVNRHAGLTSGGLTRNEISRYERGLRKPHDWLPFIAQALGVTVSWLTGSPVPASLAMTEALVQLEQETGMTLDRRTFVMDSGVVALSSVVTQTRHSRATAVSPEAVVCLRRRLDDFWTADARQSSRQLAPSAVAHFRITAHLAASAEGDLRRELWKVAAAFSGLITWLCQDAGWLERASTWGARALELAHRAHDDQLVAHSLANRAMVDMDRGDGDTTVEMADAALVNERNLCAKVKVQALQQAAHGHALVQNRRECDRLLDRAGQLIDSVDDDYPWGNAVKSSRYLETQRATCYSRLRLGEEAVRLWEQVLPLTELRNSGVFTARKAAALADARRPDEAIDVLEAAVSAASEVDSARLRAELKQVWECLSPWHHTSLGTRAAAMLNSSDLQATQDG